MNTAFNSAASLAAERAAKACVDSMAPSLWDMATPIEEVIVTLADLVRKG
jgi:hypothetical protein